ncbi:MAG: hypothetical protein C0467_01960 [Planctomycetaceae bacterium]|nr:hypothetical protein [Planctomycetaceae bacterium]
MPAIFDIEHYISLKPGSGTGLVRFLAMCFAMSIRDQATRWMLGPHPNPRVYGAEHCYYVAGVKYDIVPPPIAVASQVSLFLKQLVGECGPLTLQLGERQLVIAVQIEPREIADQITAELPISSALHEPAAHLLDRCTTRGDHIVEFADTEFEGETNLRGPRVWFPQLDSSGSKPCFLGRQRMPFHPGMHGMHPPTKFLMMVLLMCFRDGAKEVEFRPVQQVMKLWYLLDKWHECIPTPAFVWPQLVRVIERHATLIRPESSDLDVPAVGWLELRWGQDLPPDNLAVFLDPRNDSGHIRITFMRVAPETQSESKATESPTQEADDRNDEMVIEFSPDDQ